MSHLNLLKHLSRALVAIFVFSHVILATSGEADEKQYFDSAFVLMKNKKSNDLYAFIKQVPKQYRSSYRYLFYAAAAYYGLDRREAAKNLEELCLAAMNSDGLDQDSIKMVKDMLAEIKNSCPSGYSAIACAQLKSERDNPLSPFHQRFLIPGQVSPPGSGGHNAGMPAAPPPGL